MYLSHCKSLCHGEGSSLSTLKSISLWKGFHYVFYTVKMMTILISYTCFIKLKVLSICYLVAVQMVISNVTEKKIFTSGTVFVILSQFYLHLWNYLRCELKKKIIGIVIIWLAFFLLPCVSSFNSKIKMQHFFFSMGMILKCSVEPSLAFYKYKNCCFFKYSGH